MKAFALCPECFRTLDQFFRNGSIFDDFAVVIDIIDKQIQGVDSLLQPAFNGLPFIGIDDAGEQVEGPDFFGTGFVTIDVERNPHILQ